MTASPTRAVILNYMTQNKMLIWHHAPIFETPTMAKYSKITSLTCRSFLYTSGDYDIPADTMVLVNQYAISHDKRAFENPEEFIRNDF